MKKIIFLLPLLVILSGGCQNKRSAGDHEEKTDTVRHTETEHEGAFAPVTLVNGQKWKANPETTTGIRNMETLLEKFPAAPKLEDYHALRLNLEKELNQVLEKCTMSGEAHTQLHNFLLPMRAYFEKMGAGTAEQCNDGFVSLRNHLAEYTKYFE